MCKKYHTYQLISKKENTFSFTYDWLVGSVICFHVKWFFSPFGWFPKVLHIFLPDVFLSPKLSTLIYPLARPHKINSHMIIVIFFIIITIIIVYFWTRVSHRHRIALPIVIDWKCIRERRLFRRCTVTDARPNYTSEFFVQGLRVGCCTPTCGRSRPH